MTETINSTPLLGMTLAELRNVAETCGMPRFATKQMLDWIYKKGVMSTSEMTNLSKTSREKLAENYVIGAKEFVDVQDSRDGTRKFLFPASCGGLVETVYIPDGQRATVCVSSQVGCKMHCAFCLTGKQGFTGQLTTSDILNQIYSLPEREKITNIVFMGQGEPLDNYDNVAKAIEILTSEDGFAMSPKRITLSTCGILPALKKIVRESRCNIAISLHSPYHEERMEIMPIEKAYEVSEVVKYLKTCEEFRDIRGGRARETSHQRRLSFEYVLLKDKNDSQKHASDIAAMLKGLDCRVNVIPFHTYKGGEFKSPAHADAEAFCELLCRRGLNATLRRSRGQDISAACGMLAAKRKSEEAAKENAD